MTHYATPGAGIFQLTEGEVEMSNEFRGTGNLGDSPVLKTVLVRGEERKVAEMRVFFDEYKPDGQGGFEQSGGFWMTASVWDKRGEDAARHLRKGARVHVAGRLTEQEWKDKETGEVKKAMQLNADEVFIGLSRIEKVEFRQSQKNEEE
jgi:single-strand DNA-binding protein